MDNILEANLKEIKISSFFLALFAFLLPFNFLLSLAILLAILSSFIFIPFHLIVQNIKENKLLLLFSASYLLYVVAMAHTSNISFGLRDLEYKLSILILPILVAINGKLKRIDFQFIKLAFIVSSILAAIVSMVIGLVENSFTTIPTYIGLSALLHPTYFSIYLNLGLVIILETAKKHKSNQKYLMIGVLVVIFYTVFTLLLNSKIGILINLLILLIYFIKWIKGLSRKTAFAALIAFIFTIAAVFMMSSNKESRFITATDSLKAKNISKDTNESTKLRILVWKEAVDIFSRNFWIGVGTGDTKDELVKNYERNGISYAFTNRLNCHNQFLEWLITFGLLGTSIFLFSLIYPLILSLNSNNSLYIWFIVIIVAVFMVESFLEKEAGVVFFAFFNSFLLINRD